MGNIRLSRKPAASNKEPNSSAVRSQPPAQTIIGSVPFSPVASR